MLLPVASEQASDVGAVGLDAPQAQLRRAGTRGEGAALFLEGGRHVQLSLPRDDGDGTGGPTGRRHLAHRDARGGDVLKVETAARLLLVLGP